MAGAVALLLVACSDPVVPGPDPEPPPPDTVRRVVSVVISVRADSVLLGDTMTLAAAALDSAGAVIAGLPVQWRVSEPATLAVDGAGRTRALRPGRVRLEASVDGVTGAAELRIVRPSVGWQALSSSCGIWSDGAAYCWDWKSSGPFELVPRSAGGATFRSIRSGPRHHCALTEAGAAYCWGENHTGELGDGTTTDSGQPVPVTGGYAFTMIAPGILHTCGITGEGRAYCWGDNYYGQLGIPFDSTATCAGIATHCVLTPVGVSTTVRFSGIYAGDWHTCGTTQEGEAYCWGRNVYGQLGDGARDLRRSQPLRVAGNLRFDELALGLEHTCGVTRERAAYCWGMSTSGAVGTLAGETSICSVAGNHVAYTCATSPVRVHGHVPATRVTAGDFHSCAIDSAGGTYCWGYNLGGQIGNGSYGHNQFIREPVLVLPGLYFVEMAGGANVTCGLTIDGAAYCWGAGRLWPVRLPTP